MTCSLCHEPGGELINAGGDLGLVHRPCFVEYDRRAEAEEALDVFALAFEPMTVLGRSGQYEKRIADRTGERIGGNVIVALDYRVRAGGRVRRCWRVRCACGREHLVETARIETHGARPCKRCSAGGRSLRRAARVDGATIAELAERAGVSHQAIRQRLRLGWSVERLGEPGRRAA